VEPEVPTWQPAPPSWQPPTFDSTPPPPAPPAGRIRRQDPTTSRPRPPTVAEARERDKAVRRQAEAAHQAELDAAKRKKTKRRLIGAGAVVGVVGVVALGYWAFSSDDVTARCVEVEDGKEIVVPDSNCGGSPNSSGIFIYSGRQYRYYYGGKGEIGQKISNASTVKPKGANITTKSGTNVQRGGLGSKFGGSSGS
jgi:hypothetical protein